METGAAWGNPPSIPVADNIEAVGGKRVKSIILYLYKKRQFRFFLFLAAIAAVLLGLSLASRHPPTAPVYAYKEETHEIFNRESGLLVKDNDPDSLYAEIYHDPYLARLVNGARNEDKQYAWVVPTVCNDGRFMRHFFKPGIGGANGLMPIEGSARCTDAVTWARSSAGDPNSTEGDLTWTGAVDQYDYTDASKLKAYVRVGHVAHLIGDMAQPEHVHLHPHPFQDYEPWARDNFGAHIPPRSSLTIPTGITRMEDFLTAMAQFTYDSSTFTGGALAMANPPIPATSEFGQMFFVEWSSGWFTIDQWNLYNYNASGGRGTHLGNWDGDYGLRVINSDDEWWETFHETMAGARGEYTVEGDLFLTGIPAVYKGAPNTQSLANIFIDRFPPRAIEYIAGLYQHFHDVVNHPPFVQKVTVTQAGKCMYDQHWEEEIDDGRLTSRELEDDCDTDEDERWINGEDGDVEVVIEFGPTTGPIKEKVQDVEVRIGSLVVNGSLDADKRIWTGTFTPPDDGSLDGEQTIEITATDDQRHFEGRNFAGDELDTDPASPAKAQSAEPYNWQGYEPGTDENHKIKIEATPPDIEIKTKTIGPRCNPKYEVSAEVTDPDTAEISGLVRVISSGESRNPASGSTVTVKLGEVGVGGSLNYFVEAEDEAGNKERDEGTVDGPPEPPGCDHSDDNYSAASPQYQVGTTVPLNTEPTRVAILSNGFAPDASGFVNALREPNILVKPDFSPDIVTDYPLLVIPTGGLYGLENSAFFRARLEEYANRGGTIVVFDQQHGADYGVLPGGGLGGYGWAEDNSCTLSSLYIRNYDQVLSGFSDAILDSNVDGYFTDLPANSDILLHRSKNGQPAMVRYEFGAGVVIATTAYDDWGVTNWQTTADAFVLNRDLLAWAVDPALLPEYDPGNAVTLSVPVANNSSRAATAVTLHLLAPGKQIIHETTQNVNLTPGTAVSLTFNTTANTPLGIWRIDYTLLGSNGEVIQARTPGERFIVKNPHPLSAPLKAVAFTVNAPTERFIAGSDGEFTFTVWNNTSITRTLTVRYGLPHHTWETRDAATYGHFDNLSRTLVIGPESQAQFVHVFPMRTNDRLFAYLYEGSVQKDQTWFQTRKGTASVTTNLAVAQAEYMRGQTVELTAAVTNRASLAANFRLDLHVTSPGNTLVFTDTRPLPLTANGRHTETLSFVLPANIPNGLYRITANVMHGAARIGGNTRTFTLPGSPAAFNTTLPLTLPSAVPLQVTANNAHAYLPVNGTLALTITDPDGITTTLAAQTYDLTAGQSTMLPFDLSSLPAKFGVYTFAFHAQDQFSERQWTESRQVTAAPTVSLDQASYRIRETAVVAVKVSNTGDFGITPQLTVAVPDLGFSQTQPVTLTVGQTAVFSYNLALTDTLPSGFHDVTASLSLGSTVSRTQRLLVPPARLQPVLPDLAYAVGETIVVTLTNDGGVDAPITATLQLVDRYGVQVAQNQPATTVLAGSSSVLTLTVPTGAVTGEYTLRVSGLNTAVGDTFGLHRAVTITGISGVLTVQTDAAHYFTDENITALATLMPTGTPINSGNLDLKICRPGSLSEPEPPPEESLSALQSQPSLLLEPDEVGFTAITGSPLTVNVASDGSYQVIHDSVSETPGQVYYSGWDIADAGLFLWFDGYVIGPDFANHPSGSASNSYDAWVYVDQSPVIGSGAPGNPWTVTTDLIHPDSGATLSSQTSYVDGNDFFRMDWEICLPHPANVSTFLAADYYLQGSDSGFGYYDPVTGSVGGYNAAQDWFQIFTPIRPASHYLEARYYEIWNAIGSAGFPGTGFTDTLNPFLIDNGAGLQWDVTINGCSTVSAFWSFGETPTIPPVEPPFHNGCGFVLWETSLPLDTAVTLNITETVGTLDTTGRLLLWGQASSETGQPFTQHTYPFYVHDRDTGLTLETDQAAYQPGDTVQVSGVVSNTSGLTQTLTLSVTAGFEQLVLQPLTLAPGESYAYSASTFAYESLALAATAANARVEQFPLVAEPQIDAILDAPEVAGSEPFAVGLTITNTGLVPVDLDVDIVDVVSRSLTLQPGEAARLDGSLSILADTDVIAEIDGDVDDTLTAYVIFGEAAAIELMPEAAYLAGPVLVPFVIDNTGLLPVAFDTAVTLENSLGQPVASLTLPVALPEGESETGSLLLNDLALDTYTLTAVTPYGESVVTFAVVSRVDADLTAVTGPVTGAMVPVTATVTNTGAEPFSGQVSLQTSFFAAAASVVDLPAGSSTDVPLPVDTSAALAGAYSADLTLTDQGGLPVAQTAVTLTVTAADLSLTALPENLTLPVSTTVTMTFGIANNGGAAGEGELAFAFSDVADETQIIWLPGGESGTAAFTFFVPPELEAKTYEARYVFNGEPGILELVVMGVDIDVTPALDKNAYSAGETAVLTLHITEQANRETPPLYALVRFNDYSEIQPFTLAPSGSATVSFNVPVSYLGDDKVFFGIYDLASERSIHLNTVYLPRQYPDVTILTDKQVYMPGETVNATIVTTATGQLEVTAPGYTATLILPGTDSGFSFTLPGSMARGTYTIDATPRSCSCVNEDQTLRAPFDVAAPEVRITNAYLNQASYQPADLIHLHLTVASDQPVTARFLTWVERPDGSLMNGPEQTVNLAAVPTNQLTAVMALNSDQAGMHRVLYRLVDPLDSAIVHGRGAETFDVGRADLVSVSTDQQTYETNADPVQATVVVYAAEPLSGNLTLTVDGLEVHNQSVTLIAGFQHINLTLPGGYGRGAHTLRATLSQGGLSNSRETGFAYATRGPDLVGLIALHEQVSNGQAQVQVTIANRGRDTAVASMAALYDGDPAAGGTLIATLAVPSLNRGRTYAVTVPWAAAGRAGDSLLTLVADANGDVDETDETNNETRQTVTVSLLSYNLHSSQETYYRSDTAQFTSDLVNLSSTNTLTNLTLETTIFHMNGTLTETLLLHDSRPLPDLAPGQTHQEVLNWPIAAAVADFDVPFRVIQQVIMGGTAVADGLLDAAVVPVTINIVVVPEPDGHYPILNEIPTIYLGSSDTADIMYQWDDDAGVTLYTSPFSGRTGAHTVAAYPQRNGLVVGPVVEQIISVDVLPPQTTVTLEPAAPDGANGWYVSPPTITLTATDDNFGVARIQYGPGDDIWHTYVEPFAPIRDDEYVVFYRAQDWIMNTEVPQSFSFSLDMTPPVLDHGGPYVIDEGQAVTFNASASHDATSGLDTLLWDLDGDGVFTDPDLSTLAFANGPLTHPAALTGIDMAGNSTVTQTVVIVNNVPPAVVAGPDVAVNAGELVSLAPATFVDPGVLDVHTATINWGDGLVEAGLVSEADGSGTVAGSHTFANGGVFIVTVTVCDEAECQADTFTVTVTAVAGCNLYPIALHADSLVGIAPGDEINVWNGKGPGNFGWLTWTGENGIPTLVTSLTPPGDSNTYINPADPTDHEVSIGDWVRSRPGVGNSRQVRDALDALIQEESIVLPVWDQVSTDGTTGQYRTSGYALVRLLSYHLPGRNQITAEYLGSITCGN